MVWALWGVAATAVLSTYARLEPDLLYNVSGSGLEGGLSRGLVLSNFPLALVAIGMVLVAMAALSARWWAVAAPALVLCATVGWPGVVDQNDLDARLVNAVPAAGVGLALLLTAVATGREGAGFVARLRGDRTRTVVALVVAVVSLPWFAADVGVVLPGGVFLTDEVVTRGGETLAAVHLGHHHGGDGALLLLTGLLLSRVHPLRTPLRTVLTAYVSLMLAYGAVNLVEDAWHEQIAKRGWVDWQIPSALRPDFAPVWLVIGGSAVLCAWLLSAERAAADRG